MVEADMASVYLIVALLIAAVAVIFAVQNVATVTITFLAWKVTGSLSVVLLITLIMGTVIGLLVLAAPAVKGGISASSHRRRIGELEKQLDEHRRKIAELQKPAAESRATDPGTTPPAEPS
jgi:putative membrane protein